MLEGNGAGLRSGGSGLVVGTAMSPDDGSRVFSVHKNLHQVNFFATLNFEFACFLTLNHFDVSFVNSRTFFKLTTNYKSRFSRCSAQLAVIPSTQFIMSSRVQETCFQSIKHVW